jgi:serine/threonine-protein kinase HipA
MLQFLKGSDDPLGDQRLFLKAQIVFWLLGATDGHAKNFSVALAPGGRFRLTPLYDVMSAQPNVDAGQIRHNRMRLAMAVGTSRHYVVNAITPRHFIQSAAAGSVPPAVLDQIFAELLEAAPKVMAEVADNLPKGCPRSLVTSIVDGLQARLSSVESVAS